MTEHKRPSLTKAELTERLAAALAQLWDIPHEHRKQITAEQVISLGECDHNVHHAIGGDHRHYNYTWRLVRDHREKTAKVDVPQIAKTKRITAEQEAFRARMLAKGGQEEAPAPPAKPKAKIASRGFQKPRNGEKQKIPSRPFGKRGKS